MMLHNNYYFDCIQLNIFTKMIIVNADDNDDDDDCRNVRFLASLQ